jgi:hypothetical protein
VARKQVKTLSDPRAVAGDAPPPLDDLLSDIRACRACAGGFGFEPRPVVHVGPDTRLLICGQAPVRRVHESGLPFDDASGDRLRDWLGVDRHTFYGDARIGVAGMAFCFPGSNPKGGRLSTPAALRSAMAAPASRAVARGRVDAARGNLRPAMGAATCRQGLHDRDGRHLANLWPVGDPAAAPVLADDNLAPAERLV